MKTLATLFCLLFLLAAGLQWNDPDPALWMAIYGLAALLAGAAAAGYWLPIPNGTAALVFGAGFLWLLPSLFAVEGAAFTSFRMQAATHEEPREAIGLLLCVAWCAAAARRGVRLRAETRDALLADSKAASRP